MNSRADAVTVGGDFFHAGNQEPVEWQEIPLARDAATGQGFSYWSAFVPRVLADSLYKFHIRNDSAPPDWNGQGKVHASISSRYHESKEPPER